MKLIYYSLLGSATALLTTLTGAGTNVAANPLFTPGATVYQLSQGFNPPDRGAPSTTADGGSRGSCSGAAVVPQGKALTALSLNGTMPLTAEAYPTFFWYVPQTTAKEMEFTLVDGTNEAKIIYQASLTPPQEAGIYRLNIPNNENYALQEGKVYRWYVRLICNPNSSDFSGDAYTSAWIQRLNGNDPIAQQVRNAAVNDPAPFANAGVWHEAMENMAQEHRSHLGDQEMAQEWQEFLQSVQLGTFANANFIN